MRELFFLLSGFFLAEAIVRKTNLEAFFIIKTKNKSKIVKVHHLYAIPISLFLLKYTDVSYFLLGIGLHDILKELRKKFRKIYKFN